MSSSALLAEGPLDPPVLLADIKTEPPEELLASDCSQPQAEPVDLSLNKSKVAPASAPPPPPPTSVQSSPMLVAPPLPAPATVSIPPSGLSSTSAIPAVLSPGSILASTQGSGGQQILHVIHTIPSVNLPSKMGNLQTIPVVVQSLPVVYTTVPTDGVTAITVPLIGGDGKNAGSGKGNLRGTLGPGGWRGSVLLRGGAPLKGISFFIVDCPYHHHVPLSYRASQPPACAPQGTWGGQGHTGHGTACPPPILPLAACPALPTGCLLPAALVSAQLLPLPPTIPFPRTFPASHLIWDGVQDLPCSGQEQAWKSGAPKLFPLFGGSPCAQLDLILWRDGRCLEHRRSRGKAQPLMWGECFRGCLCSVLTRHLLVP